MNRAEGATVEKEGRSRSTDSSGTQQLSTPASCDPVSLEPPLSRTIGG